VLYDASSAPRSGTIWSSCTREAMIAPTTPPGTVRLAFLAITSIWLRIAATTSDGFNTSATVSLASAVVSFRLGLSFVARMLAACTLTSARSPRIIAIDIDRPW